MCSFEDRYDVPDFWDGQLRFIIVEFSCAICLDLKNISPIFLAVFCLEIQSVMPHP